MSALQVASVYRLCLALPTMTGREYLTGDLAERVAEDLAAVYARLPAGSVLPVSLAEVYLSSVTARRLFDALLRPEVRREHPGRYLVLVDADQEQVEGLEDFLLRSNLAAIQSGGPSSWHQILGPVFSGVREVYAHLLTAGAGNVSTFVRRTWHLPRVARARFREAQRLGLIHPVNHCLDRGDGMEWYADGMEWYVPVRL